MLPKTKEAINAWHGSGKAILEEYLDGLTPRLQSWVIEQGMPDDWDYDALSDWCEAEVGMDEALAALVYAFGESENLNNGDQLKSLVTKRWYFPADVIR
jgi:hypothetical protein